MAELVFHPKTKASLDKLSQGNAHAVLLTGDMGSGKQSTALYLAAKLLDVPDAKNHPYYMNIAPDGKSIGIEQIRELQKFLQLKTTGSKRIRRIAIIKNADSMTTEAQNALLKMLEEPPADTVLIMTASQPQKLKQTVHSRAQTVAILPVAKDIVLSHFKMSFAPDEIAKAYAVSNGQIGLLTAMLEQNTEHVLAKHIIAAKALYSMPAFERLAKVDELAKQKDELMGTLYACKRICVSGLEQAASKDQREATVSWHRQLELITNAEEHMKFNPNIKLLLTDLFISM
jgi:DNA polymerase-3 subunit delta'